MVQKDNPRVPEYVPDGHAEQLVDPVELETKPARHFKQLLEAETFENNPDEQGEHVDDPEIEIDVPGLHAMQLVIPSPAAAKPARQDLQLGKPGDSEKVPVEHCEHLVEP